MLIKKASILQDILTMRRRVKWSFFLFFVLLAIPFFLKHAFVLVERQPEIASKNQDQLQLSKLRLNLLLSLDLLVRAQRALHWNTGSYTRALGRVPDVLGPLTHYYNVDIPIASEKQLQITAVGQVHQRSLLERSFIFLLHGDKVLIDEKFQLWVNFPMPDPPREYLHTLARNVLYHIGGRATTGTVEAHLLASSPDHMVLKRKELDLLEGVFRGYFRYELQPTTQAPNALVAVGIKFPVKGDVVEPATRTLGTGEKVSKAEERKSISSSEGRDLFEWVHAYRHSVAVEQELDSYLEKIYLAERIHQAHTGQFAPTFNKLIPNWNTLSSLSVEAGSLVIQEFQLDSTFGFYAEITQRDLSRKAWSINGYGQVSEISSIFNLLTQWEQSSDSMSRQIATYGNPSLKNNFHRKPLLIDKVETEK